MSSCEVNGQVYDNTNDLRSAFEALPVIKADLPEGDHAYWIPDEPRQKGEWRLPANGGDLQSSDEILCHPTRNFEYSQLEGRAFSPDEGFHPSMLTPVPGSQSFNAYLNIIPTPVFMHPKVSEIFEQQATVLFNNCYPVENSLARREYDVPMLIARFDDVPDQTGTVQICELDDVPSLWSISQEYNPIVESHIIALEDQMGLPIHTAELFEVEQADLAGLQSFYTPPGETESYHVPTDVFEADGQHYRRAHHQYYHTEDWWRGSLGGKDYVGPYLKDLDEVALIVRARRHARNFKKCMDKFGPRSITMAWERDSRRPLAKAGLGVLAANLEVALEFSEEYLVEKAHADDRVVIKADGARTECTAIHTIKGTKRPGESSSSSIRRKFEKGGYQGSEPVLLQPFKLPPTLAEVGIRFLDSDQVNIKKQPHQNVSTPGETVVPGQEGRFNMIFRNFVVYLPTERRVKHIGGLWQATDGLIVHGGSHSVAGPLYVDGLMGHPDVPRYSSLNEAEFLVKRYSHIRQSAS